MSKTAVVLFNLGGPDSLSSVKPFLFNLFNDKAIIGAPQPIRWMIAKLISSRRAPVAREIYEHMGGKSPILEQTQMQADALATQLGDAYRVFIAMRYWHPRSDETVQQVKDYVPDRIVLLPLYPQYSTTTSASSLRDWETAARAVGLDAPMHSICCYPDIPGVIDVHAALISKAIGDRRDVRVLFSAHGLPKKIIASGDPYQWQVEQTAGAVIKKLSLPDAVISYQSRVGPLEWIGPATDAEIMRAGKEGKSLVVVPIAFVSEHSETLVELDIEYAKLAKDAGVKEYIRIPALQAHSDFIASLATLVRQAVARPLGTSSCSGKRICPSQWTRCAMIPG